MLVGIKNVSKLIGISIIACCAVLVCTMFLNFYFDIRLIESEITSELSMFFYNAQVSTAKVVCLVSGGCLLLNGYIPVCAEPYGRCAMTSFQVRRTGPL